MDNIVVEKRQPFVRSFLKLALPIMGQSLMMATMQVVDNVLVGRLQMGEYTISGVSQANRITFLFQLAVFGMAGGASAFFAQYWGKRDQQGIDRTLKLSCMIALLLAALFAIPSMLAPERILKYLIASESALRFGAAYLRIAALAFFPYAISLVLGASLKSTERVMLPMFAALAGVVIDALMSYVLIFGQFGAPRLEVRGAAIGTVLGIAAELLILLGVGFYKKYFTWPTFFGGEGVSLEWARKFLRVALPVMGNEFMWALGVVAYSAAYGNMDNAAVATAAVNIYGNVELIASVVLRGTTQATAVMIGILIGSGREADAKRSAVRMVLVNMLIAAMTAVPVFLCGGLVTRWFNVSLVTINSAQRLIQMYAYLLPLMSVNSVLIVGIFRPGGDTRFSMLMDVLPMWLAGVPAAFITALLLKWPIQYVFLATRIEDVIKVFLGIYRLRSGRWINDLVRGKGEAPMEIAAINLDMKY
jgi:putative MATE family efflux protein